MANGNANLSPITGALVPIPEEPQLFKLSESPSFFSSLLTHPCIQPKLFPAGEQLVDLESIWGNIVPLQCEDGGWIAAQKSPGSWEISPLFLPEAGQVSAKSHNLLHWVFCWLEAEEVILRLPSDAIPELAMAQGLGFELHFDLPDSWARPDGSRVDTLFLRISLHDWILGNAAMYVLGEAVRQATEANPRHFPAFDAYVGASVACMQAGAEARGLEVVNRLRAHLNAPPLSIVDGWLVLDGVRVQVRGGQLVVKAAQR